MNIVQRAAMKLFGIKESLPYNAGSYNLDDPENIGWQPLTVRQQNLPQWHQDRMQQISLFLYRRNPIAHRIVEVIKAFVVGDGVYVNAENPDVNVIMQKFWQSRRNNWRRHLPNRVLSKSIYGEALYPMYVNPVNGAAVIGNLSPLVIKEIMPNFRNTFEAETIVTKEGYNLKGERVQEQSFKAIKIDIDPNSEHYGLMSGDVFFFSINKPMDGVRGISDLYAIADWLDIYDTMLFNRAEKQSHMNSWLWDVTLEGYTQQETDVWLTTQMINMKRMRSGRINAHNEKIKWTAIAPDLNADDASRDMLMFMQMIWGGTGLSSQAFGDPGGSGRVVGADMNEWVFKTLSDRQADTANDLHDIFDYVIDLAIVHGMLPRDVDRRVNIFMPKISVRDLQRLTQSLRNLGQTIKNISDASAKSEIKISEVDQNRMFKTLNHLLDHIDQSSSPEANQYVDLSKGVESDVEKLKASEKQYVNGNEPIQESEKAEFAGVTVPIFGDKPEESEDDKSSKS